MDGSYYFIENGFQRKDMSLIRRGWQSYKVSHERLHHLTQDMLFFAKQRDPEYKKTDLQRVLNEVAELARNARRPAPNVKLGIDKNINYAYLDEQRFYRALLNLINNAIESVPKIRKKDIQIRISCRRKKDHFILNISDNGRGIPKEDVNQILNGYLAPREQAGVALD